MTQNPRLKAGDHVRWNSEAGHVTAKIVKVHTRDTAYKGHMRRCTEDEPQYEIKSDKTDHIAVHAGDTTFRDGASSALDANVVP
ncbi:MAG TPA: DUF2945 domain-containing protein [Thermomicrobiales bacterium]|nr:DUF2945 domain-containing protein [Thermomicrobiales bacterium]